MNLFRLAGDMTHLLSIIVLLLKIRTTKSCSGISLKTQELYVIVFLTRYLDIFTRYVSLYNTIMKLVFIGTSIGIVWYMKYHKVVKQTYNKNEDTFRHYILVLPCFVLALLFHHDFTIMEVKSYSSSLQLLRSSMFPVIHNCHAAPFDYVLWTFSLYLEAVAILPQLVLLQRSRNIDNLTGNYVFLLGAYRALYVVNWIYRYFLEDHRVRWIRESRKLRIY
ncbi:hypothetical protein Cgig2_017761 [Carnegiea gigantea]|uniref:ER lumen protein-retaining receptor n=1 Tax=Carnegiea gigantea TaxID=171969 RepID=A0A9Q1KWW2_9CARY|nr:hypothetical protein Cgig2_017761 [Carnegiea gigantea]